MDEELFASMKHIVELGQATPRAVPSNGVVRVSEVQVVPPSVETKMNGAPVTDVLPPTARHLVAVIQVAL
ncbi:MAG TPA: hypothetical protein VMU77_02105 [Acidimicrobiales bacterium]|nr:hypothetical protein [Acidimicrobiales bacterium]